jgi:hypothetical protein
MMLLRIDRLDVVLWALILVLQLVIGVGTLILFKDARGLERNAEIGAVIEGLQDTGRKVSSSLEHASAIARAIGVVQGQEDYRARLIGFLRMLAGLLIFSAVVAVGLLVKMHANRPRSD